MWQNRLRDPLLAHGRGGEFKTEEERDRRRWGVREKGNENEQQVERTENKIKHTCRNRERNKW
jgi:hypothetical protein